MEAARGIGDNSRAFGQDEPAPRKQPKTTPEQALEYAKMAERAARLIAAEFHVPKKRIIGKRQGDDFLVIRRALFRYLKGRDFPMKLMAKIFDLDRCQPGADADAMEQWEARNPQLDVDMEHLADGLDHMLSLKPKRFVALCITEIEADRAAAAAIKTAREAADMLEAPLKVSRIPAPKQVSVEAQRLAEEGQAKRRQAAIDSQVRGHLAVIRAGTAPNATKEQKRDAERARDALESLGKQSKKRKSAA